MLSNGYTKAMQRLCDGNVMASEFAGPGWFDGEVSLQLVICENHPFSNRISLGHIQMDIIWLYNVIGINHPIYVMGYWDINTIEWYEYQ